MAAGDIKGDNLGAGLTKDLFSAIVGQVAGGSAKGSVQEQIAVLLSLAREEHSALHPGDGVTSIADAVVRYTAIAQAAEALTVATKSTEETDAITKIVVNLDGLGKLWRDFGPAGDVFLDSVKTKP